MLSSKGRACKAGARSSRVHPHLAGIVPRRKHSHRRHHQNTGSVERDEVFVPKVGGWVECRGWAEGGAQMGTSHAAPWAQAHSSTQAQSL